MESHLYLSLIPEALILSQLPPDKFGAYHGDRLQAARLRDRLFFEVDPSADLSGFRMDEAAPVACPTAMVRRAVGLPGGLQCLAARPARGFAPSLSDHPGRSSLWVSDPAAWTGDGRDRFFLYQELGPVYPRVASSLGPRGFCALVTSADKLVSLPRLAFIDLKLGSLASDTDIQLDGSVPYQNVEHLRECLRSLRDHAARKTKIVYRGMRPDLLFSMVRHGLFVGDAHGLRFFPCRPRIRSRWSTTSGGIPPGP